MYQHYHQNLCAIGLDSASDKGEIKNRCHFKPRRLEETGDEGKDMSIKEELSVGSRFGTLRRIIFGFGNETALGDFQHSFS